MVHSDENTPTLIACGGQATSDGQALRSCEIFNKSATTDETGTERYAWHILKDCLPAAGVYGHQMLVVNATLFVIGGQTHEGLNSFQRNYSSIRVDALLNGDCSVPNWRQVPIDLATSDHRIVTVERLQLELPDH